MSTFFAESQKLLKSSYLDPCYCGGLRRQLSFDGIMAIAVKICRFFALAS